MCGIVGGIGKFNIRDFILDGLESLDYRGYDSAGIALKGNNEIDIYKAVGRISNLREITPTMKNAYLGIGHTRWATHGAPTEKNCHPHFSATDNFCIVHNGVIENYRELKHRLMDEGYKFYSETDTEVIANLIDEKYAIAKKNTLEAIRLAMNDLKGSYALAIIKKTGDHKIYFAKCHSPLLIGIGEGANYLASDALPMIKLSNKFIDIANYQYGYITADSVHVFEGGQEIAHPKYTTRNAELLNRDLGDYPHYMLKEIEESPKCIKRLIDNYYDGKHFLFERNLINALRGSDLIVFIACGTSYYASLVGKSFFEKLGYRCEIHIASEWAYYPSFSGKNPFFILVSQSGETADLLKCLQIINKRNFQSLAITNTKGSTLERETTYTCLLFAGVEIAVASTKAYTSQIALLALLCGTIDRNYSIIEDLENVTTAMEKQISKKNSFKKIADAIKDKKDLYFLGRGLDYYVCLEASLKLKEISYIHSDALPGGEIKHGPIALIEKGTPVIGFISDSLTEMPMRSNFMEVETRGATIYSIVSKSLAKETDTIVVDDVPLYLSILPKVMVAQYIAYYSALALGYDIDKPRNLAKSVTVE